MNFLAGELPLEFFVYAFAIFPEIPAKQLSAVLQEFPKGPTFCFCSF
jgi:hypothetical protein